MICERVGSAASLQSWLGWALTIAGISGQTLQLAGVLQFEHPGARDGDWQRRLVSHPGVGLRQASSSLRTARRDCEQHSACGKSRDAGQPLFVGGAKQDPQRHD